MPSPHPNLGFQISEPRHYINSPRSWASQAPNRTPHYPWLSSLVLAWSHTFRVGKPSWPLMPRPNVSAAWAQIHTVTLSMSPMSKKGMSGPGPRACIWGLPSPYAPNPHQCLSFPVAPPVPGALLLDPFLGETHEPDNTTPPLPQYGRKLLGAGTNPQRGILVHSP